MWHRLASAFLLLALFATSAPACASPQAQPHPPVMVKADRVLVIKSERRLYLLREGHIFATYRVALGGNPVGPKIFEGDGRTPEGVYTLGAKNENSRFHRSIRISYPSPADRQRAWKYGGPPGGDIMIHGQPEPGNKSALKRIALARSSWTDGCIAVGNADMDQIWAAVDDGTPIEILP
ncbi:MAG: L,D-transpeptidase family protein [Rhodospirillales bacterium]